MRSVCAPELFGLDPFSPIPAHKAYFHSLHHSVLFCSAVCLFVCLLGRSRLNYFLHLCHAKKQKRSGPDLKALQYPVFFQHKQKKKREGK